MRHWIVAALFVAACTTAEPQGATPPPPSHPNYGDARSSASDADVTVARRAYRAACEQHASTARCECLTGGMAQALAPADLNLATGALGGHPVPVGDAQTRIAAAQSSSERACTAYPR